MECFTPDALNQVGPFVDGDDQPDISIEGRSAFGTCEGGRLGERNCHRGIPPRNALASRSLLILAPVQADDYRYAMTAPGIKIRFSDIAVLSSGIYQTIDRHAACHPSEILHSAALHSE
jgi:hypothetical protein